MTSTPTHLTYGGTAFFGDRGCRIPLAGCHHTQQHARQTDGLSQAGHTLELARTRTHTQHPSSSSTKLHEAAALAMTTAILCDNECPLPSIVLLHQQCVAKT